MLEPMDGWNMAFRINFKIKEGWLYQSRDVHQETTDHLSDLTDVKRNASPSKRTFSDSLRSLSPNRRSESPSKSSKEWTKRYFILLSIDKHEGNQHHGFGTSKIATRFSTTTTSSMITSSTPTFELHVYSSVGGQLCNVYPLKQLEMHEMKSKSFFKFTTSFWKNKSEEIDFVLTFKNVIRDSSITVISIRCENEQDKIDWIDALKYAFHKSNFAMNLNQSGDMNNIFHGDMNSILVENNDMNIKTDASEQIAKHIKANGPGLFGADCGEMTWFVLTLEKELLQNYPHFQSIFDNNLKLPITSRISNNDKIYYIEIIQLENCIYSARYTLITPGDYKLDIELDQNYPIWSSPFPLLITPGQTSSMHSDLSFENNDNNRYDYQNAILYVKPNQISTFTIIAKDRYSNLRWKGGDFFDVYIAGTAKLLHIQDNENGTYLVRFHTGNPYEDEGYYNTSSLSIQVMLRGQDICGSPFNCIIDEDPYCSNHEPTTNIDIDNDDINIDNNDINIDMSSAAVTNKQESNNNDDSLQVDDNNAHASKISKADPTDNIISNKSSSLQQLQDNSQPINSNLYTNVDTNTITDANIYINNNAIITDYAPTLSELAFKGSDIYDTKGESHIHDNSKIATASSSDSNTVSLPSVNHYIEHLQNKNENIDDKNIIHIDNYTDKLNDHTSIPKKCNNIFTDDNVSLNSNMQEESLLQTSMQQTHWQTSFNIEKIKSETHQYLTSNSSTSAFTETQIGYNSNISADCNYNTRSCNISNQMLSSTNHNIMLLNSLLKRIDDFTIEFTDETRRSLSHLINERNIPY